MTRVSPAEGTTKWVNRLSASIPDVQAGIQKVSESPGVAAARSFQKYQNNVQASFPKWRDRVQNLGLAAWQQSAIAGTSRIAQGAQQKQDKYQTFATQFYPHLDAGVQKIKSMPNDTFEARVQRSVAMMRHNAQFKRSPGM